MELFSGLPKEILLVDAVDIEECLVIDKRTTAGSVAQQIWEGSNSIFNHLPNFLKDIFGFDGVNGVKDILNEFIEQDIRTAIFYIPKSTTKEIRKRLNKVRSDVVYETIERYILTQSRDIDNLIVYNLDDEDETIENIFNISTLKRELDRDSKGDERLYLLGLRQRLSNDEIQFYLNNSPLREEGGLILGDSSILRHKLKKGYINLFLEEDIEIEFYNTNRFISIDSSVNEDLEDVEDGESVSIDLENQNSPFILESKKDNNLVFSTDIDLTLEEENIVDEVDNRGSVKSSFLTKVSMESFFIPKDRGLKSIHLLLIEKDGQRVLAGGQYYSGLSSCSVIAEVVVNLEQELFVVTNHSKDDLSFVNSSSEWRLLGSKSSPASQNRGSSEGIYTEILTAPTNSVNEGIVTQIHNVDSENIVIKEGEKSIFRLAKINFNDSIISFDKSGVLVHYSSLPIKEFKQKLELHRTTATMSALGTVIDCFVELKPDSREYLYGARVYEDGSSKILGNFVSSQPIVLKQTSQGLEVDASLLIARDSNFKVQISASSNKYILEDRDRKQNIKKQDIDDLLIDILYANINKPLIGFSVEMVEDRA